MVVGETTWSGCGSEISESTLANLVNRTDAYGLWKGSHWVKHDGPLTVALLEQHYGGHITIGVYATSVANTCRFMVFDVDSHRKDGSAEKEASEVRAILLKYAIPHLEEDSDGLGGRHFWVRFNEVLPAGVVLSVIKQIRAQTGVTCEIFPKGERTRDAPYGGGFIRLPGKHHKHDHWSQFWVGGKWVDGEDAVAAWRSLPCINTRDLTRISEVSTQKRTEEHRGIQKNTEAHTPDFCTHLSSSVYPRIEDAIVMSLPGEERQRNKSIFAFCRRLHAIPECKERAVHEFREIVQEWHQRALPIIRTKPFDETWAEFIRAFHNVKIPQDSDLLVHLYESVSTEDVSEICAPYESETTRKLIRLCVSLDQHHKGGVFFLACRTVEKVCGFSYKLAADRLNMLVVDKVLSLVERGNESGRASRYQLNQNFSTCAEDK